ncbi:MAG: alanine racemase [Candidatus Niyogibacteria bacterium RIFCSPLOWO2_12_FULL_41_13]|uniref:Alanine racemase n=1 Tax=Candidatus Niyogibacteria bacterium RIFCSPLOWO2_12_FULL_41_13 TaxID=1801726 RepID=A0A1G2F0V8_9BACT|nr:MAG: alanine racemase [Candidatus Niyogibacteria bacterium RIFCSPLOWO2_12_FULL_41_13]
MSLIKNLRTWVEIDKRALIHNLKTFQKIIGRETELMAVVKANAYGHGINVVGSILKSYKLKAKSCLWFGVDSIDEAIALRKAGVKNKILILGWIPENRLEETIKYNLSFSLYNSEIPEKFADKRFKVHLKIETGTNRQGILIDDLNRFAKLLADSNFKIEGLYSHLADSENPDSNFWISQVQNLEKARKILAYNFIFPRYVHLASTAACLLYPETHFNLARVGLGLYGLYPAKNLKANSYKLKAELKPVLTWKTRIAQIKNIKKGGAIGYGKTYKAKKDLKIAILPVGYYDGYDRGLSNRGEVLIKSKRLKILGRVCMNMIMVDVTETQSANRKAQNIRVGDEVILLGGKGKNRISAEEMAKKLDTINYEIITRINPLIARIVI